MFLGVNMPWFSPPDKTLECRGCHKAVLNKEITVSTTAMQKLYSTPMKIAISQLLRSFGSFSI